MESCIFEGWVRHRRRAPRGHEFRYRLFMMYFDLDELDQVFAGRWLWSTRRRSLARLRPQDYLDFEFPAGNAAEGSGAPLAEAARDLVQAECGRRPEGPVRLLTHPRYFGYGFNPVSFFYLYDAAGESLEAVIAEVRNTPWDEVHRYVLTPELDPHPEDSEPSAGTRRYRHQKVFHVSPFMAMEQTYDWRFTPPGESLVAHIDNYRRGEKTAFFDATLRLRRREINGPALAGSLVRYPWMTARVTAAIYFQALRLWLKRIPFHPHPKKRRSDTDPSQTDRSTAYRSQATGGAVINEEESR